MLARWAPTPGAVLPDAERHFVSGPAQESRYTPRAAEWQSRRPSTLPRTSMDHVDALKAVLAPRSSPRE